MLLLRDRGLVVLSCEQEIASSYSELSPVPGQFSVPKPYQTAADSSKAALESVRDATSGSRLTAAHAHSAAATAPCAGAPSRCSGGSEQHQQTCRHAEPDLGAASSSLSGVTPEELAPATHAHPAGRRSRKRKQRRAYEPNEQVGCVCERHTEKRNDYMDGAIACHSFAAGVSCPDEPAHAVQLPQGTAG